MCWAGLLTWLVVAGATIPPTAAQKEGAGSALDAARTRAAEGKVEQALDILDDAERAGQRSVELLDLRAQFNLMLGRTAAAERDWRRAAALDPGAVTPRLSLARTYMNGALWADAMELYREVLARHPRDVDAILGLVDAMRRGGRKVGARKLLEAAGPTIDDPRIQERWAQLALELGRPEEAERALLLMADSAEGLAKRDALNRLVELYLSLDRLVDALAASRQALALESTSGAATEATYDLLVRSADLDVMATCGSMAEILEALDSGKMSREEAFARTQKARLVVLAAEEFITGVPAPESRSAANANRLYGYSLASEAALNAVAYIDLGAAKRREAYSTTLEAAGAELERAAAMAPQGGHGG